MNAMLLLCVGEDTDVCMLIKVNVSVHLVVLLLPGGDVRLVGDARDEVGAVELYYNSQTGWTGICADSNHIHSWRNNKAAAEIVCRQLGYQGGEPYVGRFGQ